MKPIPINLPEELHTYLRGCASENHTTIAAYVRRLILEDKKRKNNEDS